MPNRLCIEAIAGLLLVQVPPGVASASEPNAPTHKTELPVIGAGGGNTVMPIDEEQPVGNVYTIVTGPALTPVNMPVAEPTDAVAGLVLDHVPPPGQDKVDERPTQTDGEPVMATGNGSTETTDKA